MTGKFQSTLPRGSDWGVGSLHWDGFPFQSTLPRGSDLIISLASTMHSNFNPRSLAGATIAGKYGTTTTKFQSTLPRGSDNPPTQFVLTWDEFQSTLPRGSDDDGEQFWIEDCISIHAPSRERPY